MEQVSTSSSSTPSSLAINLDYKLCQDLERVFKYFDEDGDGKISPLELQRCMRTTGGNLCIGWGGRDGGLGHGRRRRWIVGVGNTKLMVEGGDEQRFERVERSTFKMYR
ncbi:hypothetical protein Leryth_019211 [Lithospermum erythrorhizon]|nr:hypothetical protein Leryth_019211 [Lithospermum erythrorhizon]